MVISVDVGLLVLRGNNELIRRKLQRLLELAATKVRRKLFVHVEQKDGGFRELLPAIYLNAASIRSGLDLRVLIDKPTITVDRIFYDEVKDPDQPAFPMLKDALATGPVELGIFAQHQQEKRRPYEHVVMGGTFDRLHNGHKVLLSEAIMLARGKITCGITDGDMNKRLASIADRLLQHVQLADRPVQHVQIAPLTHELVRLAPLAEKILYELMEPIEKRCTEVEHFVRDVSGTVQCSAVKITDIYGPSIVGNDFQAIVVSEETVKGGKAVNAKRKELGLNELAVHIVKLLGSDDLRDKVLNEVKLSSSVQRRLLLGQILKEPNRIDHTITGNHYVIGLTGGIASGKTHIAKFLAAQGCEVIECDILVHHLYAESAELRNKLVHEYGTTILLDGNINRNVLSDLVFKDKVKLKKLNSIVWPLVATRIAEIVRNSTKEIVVVDAALLLEAGWEKFLHQIWTVFVPREEAIKRICARDNLPVERASERLDHQLGNAERIARSHALFCSLWDYSETERQVKKALDKVKAEYLPTTLLGVANK